MTTSTASARPITLAVDDATQVSGLVQSPAAAHTAHVFAPAKLEAS